MLQVIVKLACPDKAAQLFSDLKLHEYLSRASMSEFFRLLDEHINWPRIDGFEISHLGALLKRMRRLEYAQRAELQQGQVQQLQTLLLHYGRQVRSSAQCGGDVAALLQHQPLLTRRAIQAAGKAFFAVSPPAEHGPVGETSTSGSSGEPVVIRRTTVNQLFWMANTLREHLWWQRDFSQRMTVIRANLSISERNGECQIYDNWGPPVNFFYRTGQAQVLSMSMDIESQTAALQNFQPGYLLTYPNNLAGLLDHLLKTHSQLPGLQQVRTIGELLPDALRMECRSVLGVPIVDTYSAQEVGLIAIQCPVSGHYHVDNSNLIVEVLNGYDEPCKAGEIGRVVVTDLHNFASPLIRYDIGDLAEVGSSCQCGRTMPVLKKIIGRNRNLVHYPDGRRAWPRVGFARFREIAPIVQYQLVQQSLDSIEVRIVAARGLSAVEESLLRQIIQAALDYPFNLRFNYFSGHLPKDSSGKFEEFKCILPLDER